MITRLSTSESELLLYNDNPAKNLEMCLTSCKLSRLNKRENEMSLSAQMLTFKPEYFFLLSSGLCFSVLFFASQTFSIKKTLSDKVMRERINKINPEREISHSLSLCGLMQLELK